MCTVLLPPGGNPISVNKYITSYHIISFSELETTSKKAVVDKPRYHLGIHLETLRKDKQILQ